MSLISWARSRGRAGRIVKLRLERDGDDMMVGWRGLWVGGEGQGVQELDVCNAITGLT